MRMLEKMPCNQCGAILMPYFLKDGTCNACRNPHLVVTSVEVRPHPDDVIDVEFEVLTSMKKRLEEKPVPCPPDCDRLCCWGSDWRD